MDNPMNPTPPVTGGGYGKRPLWQWILLYVVIGGVAYGLLYYFVFSGNGGYSYDSTTPYTAPTQTQ
ncbi:MAG TPA: hypothetical protein VJI74_01180 [Candidatus Paceibacterota bacterium]